MSHLLSDHPDWPNASVDATPTPDDDTLEIGETYQLPMTLNEIDGMTVMYQEEFELRMQKEKELAAALDLQAAYFDRCEQLLDALAAAQERIRELETALLGVKEYREKNPLGGPAKVFDAMADAIRAGDDFNAVCADYGWCPLDRAIAAEADLDRALEACKDHLYRMSEVEAERDSLKRHAEAMWQAVRIRPAFEPTTAFDDYRASQEKKP